MISRFTKRISNLANFKGRYIRNLGRKTSVLRYFSGGKYNNPDPYEILGVNKNANQEEIKRAFRILAKEYHPDKNIENEHKFRNILHAYHILSTKEKKERYDQETYAEDQNNKSNQESSQSGFKPPKDDPMWQWLNETYTKTINGDEGTEVPPHMRKDGISRSNNGGKRRNIAQEESDTLFKAEKLLIWYLNPF